MVKHGGVLPFPKIGNLCKELIISSVDALRCTNKL